MYNFSDSSIVYEKYQLFNKSAGIKILVIHLETNKIESLYKMYLRWIKHLNKTKQPIKSLLINLLSSCHR